MQHGVAREEDGLGTVENPHPSGAWMGHPRK